MTLVLRDADETFMAETETRPETFSLETETRPRHWKIPPRRDVGYVSRPSRDRDVETETTSLVQTARVSPA